MKMVSLVAAALVALSSAGSAQVRVSVGAGGGVAGSTESSLSNGTGAFAVMGQVVKNIVPFVGVGGEVNYWWRSDRSVAFGTAILQAHPPAIPLLIKVGLGYGGGDPDDEGTARGFAGEIGIAYDITIPAAPVGFTVFVNGLLANASARSVQMVAGGLAITWR
jgi:hypothetical protein